MAVKVYMQIQNAGAPLPFLQTPPPTQISADPVSKHCSKWTWTAGRKASATCNSGRKGAQPVILGVRIQAHPYSHLLNVGGHVCSNIKQQFRTKRTGKYLLHLQENFQSLINLIWKYALLTSLFLCTHQSVRWALVTSRVRIFILISPKLCNPTLHVTPNQAGPAQSGMWLLRGQTVEVNYS